MTYAASTDRYPVNEGIAQVTREMKINTAVTVHQGDALMWDTTNNYATPMTADTDGIYFCGVMLGRIPVNAGAAGDAVISHAPVIREGVVLMKSTAEETYKHGNAVQMGDTDAQQIKLLGQDTATQIIGTVYLPNDNTGSITGATGTYVPVLLRQAASNGAY